MNGREIAVTPSAYFYPLLIKQLLHTSLAQTAHQEIVYRDVRRLTYLELRDRIGRQASAQEKLGVRPGDSVGVLDWDRSPRTDRRAGRRQSDGYEGSAG